SAGTSTAARSGSGSASRADAAPLAQSDILTGLVYEKSPYTSGALRPLLRPLDNSSRPASRGKGPSPTPRTATRRENQVAKRAARAPHGPRARKARGKPPQRRVARVGEVRSQGSRRPAPRASKTLEIGGRVARAAR